MAYDPEQLTAIVSGMSGTGNTMWNLDTTDAIAAVNTDGYISDGATRGMSQGDLVWVKTRSAVPLGAVTAVSLCVVASVGATSVDLTDGLTIPMADAD